MHTFHYDNICTQPDIIAYKNISGGGVRESSKWKSPSIIVQLAPMRTFSPIMMDFHEVTVELDIPVPLPIIIFASLAIVVIMHL